MANCQSDDLHPEALVTVGTGPKRLKMSNGAGLPLLSVLAKIFTQDHAEVTIQLQQNISPASLKLLTTGRTDIALTFERSQEKPLVESGQATVLGPVFAVGFALVGPHSNPAKLTADDDDIASFKKLYACVQADESLFVSRGSVEVSLRDCASLMLASDRSVGHIVEVEFWQQAKRDPGPLAGYKAVHLFPPEALKAADELDAYMLIDVPTLRATADQIKHLQVYKYLGRSVCNALTRPDMAQGSPAADWYAFISSGAGQRIIRTFPTAEQAVYHSVV